ncbi:hypothetical protein [Pararhizobium sp.]|uniref:hypothetical protein n=1 Tax=Pararhizobium sp. TaxID=1977563 RepID=UPI003BA9A85D
MTGHGTFRLKTGYAKTDADDQEQGIFMGQVYHFNVEHDELLSEAERAFDLSARRQSMPKITHEAQETPRRPQVFKAIAGLFTPAAFRSQPN